MLAAMLRQPLWPADAAAAIDEKRRRNRKKYFLILVYCGFFYCGDHLRIWLESIATIYCGRAAIKKKGHSSSIAALFYCGALGFVRSAAIRVLFYGPQFDPQSSQKSYLWGCAGIRPIRPGQRHNRIQQGGESSPINWSNKWILINFMRLKTSNSIKVQQGSASLSNAI